MPQSSVAFFHTERCSCSVHLVIEGSGIFVDTVTNHGRSSLSSSYGLEHAEISLCVREYSKHFAIIVS